MDTGTVEDMWAHGICDSYQVKKQVVISSSEAAEMILRVDDIVQCAPRNRQQ
jgi:T-complex protein 1 subunit beta